MLQQCVVSFSSTFQRELQPVLLLLLLLLVISMVLLYVVLQRRVLCGAKLGDSHEHSTAAVPVR